MKTKTIAGCIAVVAGLALAANPALAQDGVTIAIDLKPLGQGLGAGLCGLAVVGGGPGIGRIGGSACEAIARQPEAASTIGTYMIITAALVEGATLFAVVIGLLALFLI